MGNVLRDGVSGDAPRRTQIAVVCSCVVLASSRAFLMGKTPAARTTVFQALLRCRYLMYHNVRIEAVTVKDREKKAWPGVTRSEPHAY
jgi:hypothetical protein